MSLVRRPRSAQAQPIVLDAESFLGDELLAATTAAGGQPLASVPNGARHAYIFNLDTANKVILRLTSGSLGGAPDATHGIVIGPLAGYDLTTDPSQAKLLGVVGTVNVFVSYFGEA